MADALTAAQRSLEAAQKAAEKDMEAAALAEKLAAEAMNAASEAQARASREEAEAADQEKTGRGPRYRAAKAKAEAARKDAEAKAAEARRAEQQAAAARARVEAANERAKVAGARIHELEKAARQERQAKEMARQTAIAIGGGAVAALGIAGTQAVVSGHGVRKEVKILEKQTALVAAKGEKVADATRKIKSSLDALNKTGVTKPLTVRQLAGKSSVPLGISAALMGTSTYLKSVAAEQRKLGNDQIASGLETFALGEQYAAVALSTKAAVGATYSALSKLGKPQLSVRQLAVVEEAKKIISPAKAPKPVALPKPGSLEALKVAARSMGVTVPGRQTKAALSEAIAKTASANAKAATKSALTKTATSALKTAGSVGLKAAGKLALPVTVAMTAVAAYQGYQRGGIKGAVLAAADELTFGATSAVAATLSKPAKPTAPSRMATPAPRPKASVPTPTQLKAGRIQSAAPSSVPVSRIASAGTSKSRVSVARVDSHFKDRAGKSVFTRAHVRMLSP